MERFARMLYQPCCPLGTDGRCITAGREHTALSRNAAAEGMVLLKNENGALPLGKNEKIAIFGNPSVEYIKDGGAVSHGSVTAGKAV